jgi:hypothetical protein
MDIRQILLARTIQFFKIGSPGYLPEIAQKIKERYEFVVSPRSEDLLSQSPDATKAAEFKHGRVKNIEGRSVIIQQLAVFPDGIVADTTTSTEDSDLFISDLYTWAQGELSADVKLGHRRYISNLEFQTTNPLEIYAPIFGSIGNAVTKLLSDYGLDVAPYQFSKLTLNIDEIGAVPPQPAAFQLERRAKVAFKENMWFSQAPLKTKDHIKVLQDLEKVQ